MPDETDIIPDKPEFLTNSQLDREITVAKGINRLLEHYIVNHKNPPEVAIATAYFNPGGFEQLRKQLKRVGPARLLLGAEPEPTTQLRELGPDEHPDRQEANRVRRGLKRHIQNLAIDRDLLGFTTKTHHETKKLLKWLDQRDVEVRRYEKGFLHGKCFIVEDKEAVIAGSSNFTRAGLTRNLELNLGQYSPTTVGKVKTWFDNLWEEAVPFDLAAIYAERFDEFTPFQIYLKMLWMQFRKNMEDEKNLGEGRIKPTIFQTDGIVMASQIIEEYGGVLIADGVGLGKSYVAGSLIENAHREGRRALLVVPAALRDGMWSHFLDEHQIACKAISFEQLGLWSRSPNDIEYLGRPKDEYSMIVIDESHAFRNRNTMRRHALRQLLRGEIKKDVVLMTATPVNNTIMDLYNLLTIFIRNDAAFAHKGIRSMTDRFKEALAINPEDLDSEILFQIIDSVTIRRTRRFIQKHYADDRIVADDGTHIQIKFPEPTLKRVDYVLFEKKIPGFLSKFMQYLQTDPQEEAEGKPPKEDEAPDIKLRLARFNPTLYLGYDWRDPDRIDREERVKRAREIQLDGLMRINLLKRLESSVEAFRKTCQNLKKSNDRLISVLKRGKFAGSKVLNQWVNPDTDDIDEFIESEEGGFQDIDTDKANRFIKHLEEDNRVFDIFLEETEKIDQKNDTKLTALSENLKVLLSQAKEDGEGDEDQTRDNRKVIIFSYFKDTVDWITDYLKLVVSTDPDLSDYANRIVSISGSDSSREREVNSFCPKTMKAHGVEDKYDILVCTDVLAEGMNLQQARNIINYDLPWNPMRIAQRNGRIDRIGSEHDQIFINSFFPDKDLDDLLLLEERLSNKIHQAAKTVGVEDEILPGTKVDPKVFTESRKTIEKMRQNDSDGVGEDTRGPASGEEFRQDLRKGLVTFPEDVLNRMPWGAGSGFYREGNESCFVFCALVGNKEEPLFVQVKLDPKDEKHNLTDSVLQCLSTVQVDVGEDRVLSEDMYEKAFKAWEVAREFLFSKWIWGTDPANLQTNTPKANRDAIQFLRTYASELPSKEFRFLVECLESKHIGLDAQLREAMSDLDNIEKTVKNIKELIYDEGLEPTTVPPPNDLIEIADIHLVCWMAIEGDKEWEPGSQSVDNLHEEILPGKG